MSSRYHVLLSSCQSDGLSIWQHVTLQACELLSFSAWASWSLRACLYSIASLKVQLVKSWLRNFNFTSSHSAPRLPGPASSCWGLRPVLKFGEVQTWIGNDRWPVSALFIIVQICQSCQKLLVVKNLKVVKSCQNNSYNCFKPGQKRAHTRNPLK